jgi:hypothetical protein
MQKGIWTDPWGQRNPRLLANFNLRAMNRNQKHAAARRQGVLSGAGAGVRRSMMAGDPSWLSQFVKHNSGIVKKLVGVAGAALAPITGGASMLAAGLVNSRVGISSGGSTKLATNPVAPLPNMMFRPTATAGMGKAAGMTAGLAPLPPNMNILNTLLDPGTYDLPSDGSDTQDNPSAPADPGTVMTAIPSSGGGSMLFHHFFGKSNSKAIPVSQTNGVRPSGYHLNKHGFYLSSIATWIQPGTVWVKSRRRNPLNPRALHRSIARLVSARHAVKRLGILETVRHKRPRRRIGSGGQFKRLKAG